MASLAAGRSDDRRGARQWVGLTRSRSVPPASARAHPAPLWAAGLAVALIALGFGRGDRPRHAARRPASRFARVRPDEARADARNEGRQTRQEAERGGAFATRAGRPRNALARASRNRSQDTSLRGTAALRAAIEPGRGRHADTPSGIPARGWKDILLRIYHNLNEHRVLAIAAGVTFYILLAIFPAIAALVSVYGLFADAGTIASHLTSLASILPGGAIDIIGEQIGRLTAQPPGRLGFTFFVSLAISPWSANAGIKGLCDALNIVYGEQEKRSFIKLNLVSLTFTVGGLLFALLAIAIVVALPVGLNYVGLGRATDLLIRIGRWPVMY